MAMDERFQSKRAGCVRKKCNNRLSGYQWCTSYSCCYNRHPKFLKPIVWKGGRQVEPPERSMIETQRAEQRKVMEHLNRRWNDEVEQDKRIRLQQDRSKLQDRPACWQQNWETTDSQFPEFELFPAHRKRYPPTSHPFSGHPSTCAPLPPIEGREGGGPCSNVELLPRDIMEPRFYMTSSDRWKGVSFPFTDSRYELLIPAVETMSLLPSPDPFSYVTRKGRKGCDRAYPLDAIPDKVRRREVFGNPLSVDATTNFLGFRPQRHHPKQPPTFLWV